MKRTQYEEWGPEPYNAVYVERGQNFNISNGSFRSAIVARYVLGESVLDLACGAGQLANMIDNRRYFGVDFSYLQIQRGVRDCQNPNATFALQDLTVSWDCEMYDTVVMGEIVEHLDDPQPLVQFAIDHARRRVIATVPENMVEPGHAWGKITMDDLTELFGAEGLPDWALIVHRFRGARGWWRWLVIRDIDGYVEAKDYGLEYIGRLT